MGYDYTRKFLEENAVTVNQLTELFNNNGVVAIAFSDQAALTRQRQKISNVLSSMALHFPAQYKDLRDRVRTWSLYDTSKEEWILYVGSPRHKIAGRKPGMLGQQSMPTYGPAGQTGKVEEEYGKLIDSGDAFGEFVRWVVALPPGTLSIRAELSDPPDNDEFLDPFKAVGWSAVMEGPTTLVLNKPSPALGDRNA